MSQIILQQLDFSTLPFPVGEFILGVDVLDGLPKLRTPSDSIILGITGSSYLQFKQGYCLKAAISIAYLKC